MADKLLQEDGISHVLQEDGSSHIELEYTLVNWWPHYPNVVVFKYAAVASGEQA
jgi:hypothetical protein